ncbi:Phosphatidylglycerophosphate synthase [Marininema mesophilum]|uniref:Phosphatidylglycerophosphate synthase n=1 Tax=Marininema mesophilum TaxID=1048340 RepID=A0A1H2YWT7_9BACL|nr:CDP-alcohol phosphatidyltransferase family protein [Marininema mesophilum]SDX09633.1 Phosphatidylglycerophosphate synthase [Marininema mesophilum]
MKNVTAKKLPTLPVDSERILEYRSICQKPRQSEEIWSWYVLRRISIYVTVALSRTRITPNGVSWLSLFFFILCGWMLATGEVSWLLGAVVAYNLGYLGDCLDGELARLTKVTSRLGVFLDTLIRAISIPMTVGMALGVYRLWSAELSLITVTLIYLAALMGTLALLVPLAYNYINLKSDENDPVSDMRTTSTRLEWIAFFTGMPGFFALLPLAIVVEWIVDVPFISGWVLLYLTVMAMKTMIRLYLTTLKLD